MKKLTVEETTTLIAAYHVCVDEAFSLRDLKYGYANLHVEGMGMNCERVFFSAILHPHGFKGRPIGEPVLVGIGLGPVDGSVPLGEAMKTANAKLEWLLQALIKNWSTLEALINPDEDAEVEDIAIPIAD